MVSLSLSDLSLSLLSLSVVSLSPSLISLSFRLCHFLCLCLFICLCLCLFICLCLCLLSLSFSSLSRSLSLSAPPPFSFHCKILLTQLFTIPPPSYTPPPLSESTFPYSRSADKSTNLTQLNTSPPLPNITALYFHFHSPEPSTSH